jgi:spore germination protein GerM
MTDLHVVGARDKGRWQMIIKFWQVQEVLATIATLLIAQSVAVAEIPTAGIKVTQKPQAASYWVLVEKSRTRMIPVQVALAPQASSYVMLSAAFSQLLSNPNFSSRNSSIPANTKLLSMRVDANDVYIDLSKEFLAGGGSASMINRLHQVVYTATSLNPNGQVFISVEGKPLDEKNPLAGEGLMVRYPINRQQLAEDFAMH